MGIRRHDVWGISGRRYAPWINKVTYKPGTSLTLSDEMAYRAWHNRWHPEVEAVDLEVTLRIEAWVEDSTIAWPDASWSEAELTPRYDPGGPIEAARPLLVRHPVRVAMVHQVPAGITDFADFLGEVRHALLAFETHERDEWLKVATPDGRVLPFDPHAAVAQRAKTLGALS